MINISGTTIEMTRGDSLIVTVEILDDQGQTYQPVNGDKVRFAMKSARMGAGNTRFADARPLIKKTIPIDTLTLELEPSDTEGLSFGEYVYDIELTHASGAVDTFIADARLRLMPEVD